MMMMVMVVMVVVVVMMMMIRSCYCKEAMTRQKTTTTTENLTSVNVGLRQGETSIAGTKGEVGDSGCGPDGGGDGEPQERGTEKIPAPPALASLRCGTARKPGHRT